MKFLRRLITWSCFVGLLAAVGVPVFFWVRHMPRCTIDGRLRVHHLSADGRWLLATDFEAKTAIEEEDVGEGVPVERTRLKIFDTSTGRPVAAFDSNIDSPLSANGRHFVHRLGRDTFVIDLDTGEQWQLPVVHDEHFSRDGNALHILDEDGWASVCLATRQVVRRFDTRVTAYPTENRFAVLKTGKHIFDVVDVDSGRTKQSLATGIDLEAGRYWSLWVPNERWFALCTNGNRSIVPVLRPFPGIASVCARCEIWDRAQSRPIDSFGARDGELSSVMFSEDNRSAAMWRRIGATLEFVLLDLTLNKKTKFTFGASPQHKQADRQFETPFGWGGFSPDGSHFLLSHWVRQQNQITMFDVRAGSKEWEKVGAELVLFASDLACLVATQGIDRRLEILDVGSGETRVRLRPELPFNYRWAYRFLTIDQRSIPFWTAGPPIEQPASWKRWPEKVLPGFRGGFESQVAVVDLLTGRERFRLNQFAHNCHLSKDEDVLLTVAAIPGEQHSQRSRIQIWEVSPRRAYFWTIIWSIGVGVVLSLLRRWWQMRRPKRPSSQPATT